MSKILPISQISPEYRTKTITDRSGNIRNWEDVDPNYEIYVDEQGRPLSYNPNKGPLEFGTEGTPYFATNNLLANSDTYKVFNKNADLQALYMSDGIISLGLFSYLNLLSPTSLLRAIVDPKGYWNSIMGGNTGLYSEEYARQHPYKALAGNLLFDGIIAGSAVKLVNTLQQRVYNPIMFNRAFNKALSNLNLPTPISTPITTTFENPYSYRYPFLRLKDLNTFSFSTPKRDTHASNVHLSNESDLVRPGRLVDDFYEHTFNFDAGDVLNYKHIRDFTNPINSDVLKVNREIFVDILNKNIESGQITLLLADELLRAFDTSKVNLVNKSLLPPEYQKIFVQSINPEVVDNFVIDDDGRIFSTFKVGLRWKGFNAGPNAKGWLYEYISDARNMPAGITVHEDGHGILKAFINKKVPLDIKTFTQGNSIKETFVESLSNSELQYFLSQPPSVLEILFLGRNILKDVPLLEATNVARDIRAKLTTKGIKSKAQLDKYIESLSDDEILNMYNQSGYIRNMLRDASSKREYIDFLKKLITGTALSTIIGINNE